MKYKPDEGDGQGQEQVLIGPRIIVPDHSPLFDPDQVKFLVEYKGAGKTDNNQ